MMQKKLLEEKIAEVKMLKDRLQQKITEKNNKSDLTNKIKQAVSD